MLGTQPWQQVSWRRGTKGRLFARFAALRACVADGPPQRVHDMGTQHLPGEEAWLVGEQRFTGERKVCLSTLPADTSLRQLAAAIKARRVCEQAHQHLKEELGLDHVEGRSRPGLHQHALLTMVACAFLQSCCLAQAGQGRKGRPNRRLNPACPQSGRPSSPHSRSRHPCAARTVTGCSKPRAMTRRNGERPRTPSQNMTVAAKATAERNTMGQRS